MTKAIDRQPMHQQDFDDRAAVTRRDKEDRALLSEAGHSCLTCGHIKHARGQFLHCSLKDKNVKQYNICTRHSAILELREKSNA